MEKTPISRLLEEERAIFDEMETESAPSGEWEEYNWQYLQQEAVVGALTEAEYVVGRCEDCKLSEELKNSKSVVRCVLGNGIHPRGWYCADFERRDEETEDE